MTNLNKKIASAIAAGAILLNTALPVFAQVTLEISGNGSDSDNTTNVALTNTTTVSQSNFASISNDVDADSNTGGNRANDNTNGSVEISTGNATTTVGVSNAANSNTAVVDCCVPDVDVLISGNGSDSDNDVNLALTNSTSLYQDNVALLKNDIYAGSNTGDNRANDNTGGDVLIDTGNASTTVVVQNQANANSARIGGGEDAGSVSLRIIGNGSDSDNDITLALTKSLTVSQSNFASIKNDVDAYANTGDNRANDNTNGEVSILTGDADVAVGIDNLVNFNWVDLDCGCLLDVLAKIAGNGSDSDNDIRAALTDTRSVWQDNVWVCGRHGNLFPRGLDSLGSLSLLGGHNGRHDRDCNDVDAYAGTGDNKAEDNTGGVDGFDPLIDTGNAETEVLIQNEGNANVLGDGLDFPELPEWELELGFNWFHLWSLFVGGLG